MDPAVYTILHSSRLYILAIYVDDCILVGKQGPFIILNSKKNFSSRFQIKDLGHFGKAFWDAGSNEIDPTVYSP